ncbi:MAG TPA: glycine betaine ABC transporter substrate-binding protein [Gemmatimonadales bacterium]|nr:glycine betaine ABC transporter substrate-binding protein [Gemmatimonadales bacterium]
MIRPLVQMLFAVGLLQGSSPPGGPQVDRSPRRVVVASKPFGESYLLAEMFAQLLESRGYRVDRRLGLGATEIAFQALRTNRIDVYPEYTGTGLLAILGRRPISDPAQVYREVSREFRSRYGARWLPPLGFQNTYAIAVRSELAQRLHLATLSDLAAVSGKLRAGLTPDFIGRPDGLPGLERVYGVHFRSVRALLPAIKYQALAAGEVDVIDGYSTDGFIARYDLVVLKDDRRFFPPYEAAALISPRFSQELPAGVAVLTEISGLLTEEDMRRFNRRIEVDNEPIPSVAADALRSLGVLQGAAKVPAPGARPQDRGVLPYLWDERATIAGLTLRHLLLVGVSLTAALALALPLGLILERSRKVAESVIRTVSLLQTLPSIALLAFMIPLLGIGVVPALVALFLYSLYPILRNTYTGVRDAAPDAVGAARALGMTPRQILRYVRLPLAAPIIMAGIRTAAVINVGTATLAAFIGAGGLGDPIAAGLALSDTKMILSGALPAAGLALLVDGVLGMCERLVAPGG